MTIFKLNKNRNSSSEQHDRKPDVTLFKNMPQGFAWCKMIYENGIPVDFIYLDVNDAFGRITGMKKVTGRRARELSPNTGTSLPELIKIFGRVAEGKGSRKFESFFESTLKWISTTAFSHEKGYFISILEDITERKKTEFELQKSELRYRQLVEISPDAIAIHCEGKVVFVNKAGVSLMGAQKADQLIGRPALDFIHPEERESVKKRIAEILKSGKTEFKREERFVRLDGSIIDVETVAIATTFQDKPAVQVVIRDISERKRNEKTLKESEEKYRTLVDHATESIVVAQDGRFKFVNKKILELTGYTEEELFSRPFIDFIEEEDRAIVMENHRKRLEKKPVPPYSFRFRNKDNSFRWVNVTGVVIDWNGRIASLNFLSDITAQKKAQLDLENSEKINRTLVEHLPQRIFIKDRNSNYILCNENYSRDLGIKPAEIKGKNDYDFFPPDYAEVYQRDDRKVMTEGIALNQVERYMIAGKERFTDVRKVPFRDADNNVVGVLGIFEDITELIRVQKDLKLFRALMDHSSDAIMVVDPENGRILDANERTQTNLGYSREELLAKSIFEINTSLNPDEFISRIKILKESGNFLFEGTHRRKNGSTYPVEINLKYTVQDREYIVAVIRDITERKKADQHLRLQSAALQAAANAIIITNTDGIIIQANPAFLDLTGYTAEEVIGNNPRDLIKSDLNNRSMYDNMWKTIMKGEIWHGELINRRKDQSTYHEEMTITPVRDESGKITRFIAIKQDISKRIKNEEEIRKFNTELEYRIEQRTRQLENTIRELESITYTISHDLRAPLRSLNGFSQILIDEFSEKLDAEAGRYLSVIHKNSEKMGELIDDLLAFSRLGRRPMKKVKVDMGEIVRNITHEVLGTRSAAAEIKIRNMLPAVADYGMMTEIWMNLINNAVKYTSKREKPEIIINSYKENGETIFSIKDNGAGFNMKYNHKLFGVFQRLHSDVEFEGTGIGLAIVKRIVSMHGGRVWAEGEINKGAAFYFSLPASSG